jgi:DNA-binding winged helix-turn-helix (wHTH) protein/TolB-like protein/tetratricopeptide (TPR) repeat protein
MSTGAKRIYRFADFTLDVNEHRLLRDSGEIYLQPKTFETLVYLIEHHGHLATKKELLDALWAETFVTENALSRCIKEVREALGDDAYQPRYIKTVPRLGYKFIADVEQTSNFHPEPASTRKFTSGQHLNEKIEQPVSTARSVRYPRADFVTRIVVVAAVAGVTLIVIVLLIYAARKKQPEPSPRIRSIAVLPFKPLGGNARDESLELGIADALITSLGQVGQLTVRPTSAVRRYTALDQDPLAAGREQQVDAVLEGTIQTLQDEIRVTVRLLRVADGAQLWSDKFDQKSTDVFIIQDSISEQVARTLSVKLTGEDKELLTKRYTSDPEAYQFYLKGRYFLNKSTGQDFRKSIEYFQKAVNKDPNFALAYAGLADSYSQLGSFSLVEMRDSYESARIAATNALKRDENLSEAHATLGYIMMSYYWDWPEAEKQFKKAIDLNANYGMAHNWYSQYLAFMGRSDEADKEAKLAQRIDPLSPWNNSAFVSFLARKYEKAILESQKTLELDPNFAVAHMIIGLSYVEEKNYQQGISELQKATDNPDSEALLAYAYAVAGKRTEALAILADLEKLSRRKYVASFPIAPVYAALGDRNNAFKQLEKAYAERSWAMGMLKVNPVFDSLRSDPRFSELLRRMKLAN